MEAVTKLSWEKEDSPLTGIASDGMQHGMVQVTPVSKEPGRIWGHLEKSFESKQRGLWMAWDE